MEDVRDGEKGEEGCERGRAGKGEGRRKRPGERRRAGKGERRERKKAGEERERKKAGEERERRKEQGRGWRKEVKTFIL